MNEFSIYAIRLLKDASSNPGHFNFVQSSDGSWPITPYGKCDSPQECIDIKIALEELQEHGFIRELVPNGGTFEITQRGIKYAQKMLK